MTDPRLGHLPLVPTGASAWQRLAPFAAWRDPRLQAIETALDEPETARALRQHELAATYPRPIVDRLFGVGLAELFHANPTVLHLASLNALTARRSASLAITLGVNALAHLPAYIGATEAQLELLARRGRDGALAALLLTELAHGSNLLANEARAERGTLDATGKFVPAPIETPATHFKLSGQKDLINGGERHETLVVLARTKDKPVIPDDGPLAGRDAFTVFFVERDATTVSQPRWRTLPATAADISGVRFEGTIVPAANILVEEGEGFGLIQKTLSISRGAIGALASGVATRARELALGFARERAVYGEPILRLPPIADHLMKLEALDLLVAAMALKAAASINAVGLGAAPVTAVAKFACCALAEEAVTEGRRVLGSRALVQESPYEALVRDVLLYGVFDGTSHVMLAEIQWRLGQLARPEKAGAPATGAATGPLDETRRIFASMPHALTQSLRARQRSAAGSLERHLTALAALPGSVGLEALRALGACLLDFVRELQARGRWEPDAATRFEAAEILAGVEALVALVELADPERRLAAEPLGVEPAGKERHALAYAFTVGWFGARLASRLATLALRHGVDAAPAQATERAFLEPHERDRAAFRARL